MNFKSIFLFVTNIQNLHQKCFYPIETNKRCQIACSRIMWSYSLETGQLISLKQLTFDREKVTKKLNYNFFQPIIIYLGQTENKFVQKCKTYAKTDFRNFSSTIEKKWLKHEVMLRDYLIYVFILVDNCLQFHFLCCTNALILKDFFLCISKVLNI